MREQQSTAGEQRGTAGNGIGRDRPDPLEELSGFSVRHRVDHQGPGTGGRALVSRSNLQPRWYSTAQVAELLGFGLYKTKMLISTGELRSLKDGRYRRILPEWVDEYIARRVEENR
jgi:excisionase family DNA binding protein